MTVFFTSDLHFSHANILKYQPDRPWANVQDMNEGIISNWNSVVTPQDEVYIIGDFAFAQPVEVANICRRLNGNKFLVKGNHDDVRDAEVRAAFGWIKDYYELNVDLGGKHKQKICMHHYAGRVWNKSHHGSWQLYGHSHGSLPPQGKQIDVGIDATILYKDWFGFDAGVKPFCPVSLDQLKQLLDSREINKVDHH